MSLVFDCLTLASLLLIFLPVGLIAKISAQHAGKTASALPLLVCGSVLLFYLPFWVTKVSFISINLHKKKVRFFTTLVIFFFLSGIVGIILGVIALVRRDGILHPVSGVPLVHRDET